MIRGSKVHNSREGVYNPVLSVNFFVELHASTVTGDTVGDPFKDTSSVAMNPIIKFSTLFGILAIEIALVLTRKTNITLAVIFFILSAFFVARSFYGMRIRQDD